MNIAMLEGWTITSLETVEAYDRTTHDCLIALDEVKNFSLKNTEDKSEVKGKGENTLFIIKKNKEGIIPFGPFLLIGALMTMYFASIIGPLVEKLII